MMPALIFAAAHTVATIAAAWQPCAGLSPRRWLTCVSVAGAARAEGVPVNLAVALAWSESRFDADAANPSGAVGPMQVKPRFWCPGGRVDGCDLARAGVVALRSLTGRHGAAGGICRYAAGNVYTRAGRRYARWMLGVARDGWRTAARERGEAMP